MEESNLRVDGVNVGFGGGRLDDVGRFYLEISVFNKEPPNGLNDPGTSPQRFLLGRKSFLFPAEGPIP